MAEIYNSNSNLKAAGVTVQFTPENIQEYIKCSQDYVYFIENYCYIVTLDHGLQLFKLYECQRNKLNVIHENRRVILMEGRQQGKTTTSAAYILWYTLFQANKTVAILANKATSAREVLNRYQTMYELLPQWMQQGVTTWNKGDIELENGSKVFTSATSASSSPRRSAASASRRPLLRFCPPELPPCRWAWLMKPPRVSFGAARTFRWPADSVPSCASP